MANLHLLTHPETSEIGAVLLVFPDRAGIELSWRRKAPITDTLDGAKTLAAQFVQALLVQNCSDHVSRTNWASVTAAIQRHLVTWNEARRTCLYSCPDIAIDASSPGVVH